jgi:hypothetical protein
MCIICFYVLFTKHVNRLTGVLTPTLAVFQPYPGMNKLYKLTFHIYKTLKHKPNLYIKQSGYYFIKQRMSYNYHMVYINASSITDQENVDNLIQDDSHLLVNWNVLFTCNFSKTPKNIQYIFCCLTYFVDEINDR